MKTITVHRKILDDPVVFECFKDQIGTQLYLHIGTTHLRSQFFNQAILSVAEHLRKLSKEALHRMDEETLDDILRRFGRSDPAVAEPWRFTLAGPWHKPEKPGGCYNWRSWNDRLEQEQADAENMRRERKHKMHRLLDAVEGIDPWQIEWKEDSSDTESCAVQVQ